MIWIMNQTLKAMTSGIAVLVLLTIMLLSVCFVVNSDDIAMEKTSSVAVYHEKQSLMLCAIHAVNNLLQCQGAFTKRQFDEICCQ